MSAFVTGLRYRPTHSCSLNKYKDNFIAHNFWSEIAQIMDKDEAY